MAWRPCTTVLQGTDGPWVGNMASVLCGSPHIYVAAPGEQDWWVHRMLASMLSWAAEVAGMDSSAP